MTEETKDSPQMQEFRSRVRASMDKIKNLDQFRAMDKMIDYVFKIGREMFEQKLDNMSSEWMLNTGGKLVAIYAYLGNLASYARAKRDVAEQRKEEIMSEFSLDHYSDTEKITVARAKAKVAVKELDEEAIIAEHEKNNLENLMSATEKMVAFLQSAIKVKEGERFSANMQDRGE